MKAALVYQAGIANVFMVDNFFYQNAEKRNAQRLFQGAFHSAIMFAQGMKAAGATIETFGCNMAGDITNAEWTDALDDLPFSEKFTIVKS